MKRRDYLKNLGLSSLGLAVLSPDVQAAESLDIHGVPKSSGELKFRVVEQRMRLNEMQNFVQRFF